MSTTGIELREDATSAQHAFDRVLLDDGQRRVLDLPDGASASVIGAPGTGKTTALIELVAERVLGRGYSPSEILALAPTRSGASALRDTIALRLGVPTNGPVARTVNSVAFQIVTAARATQGEPAPTLLTGGEQDQIIAELLQGHLEEGTGPAWPDHLGPDVRRLRGFRTELRDLMMRAVEYGVPPVELARLGAQHGRPEWQAAAEFIRDYEDVKDLARPGQYDSTELAQYAAAVVRSAPAGTAAVLGPLAGLRLILVDDAQECTQATLTLLAQFAARGVAVVAFGDPDISTGSFRGAHPDTLGRLAAHLGSLPPGTPAPEAIVLDTVYRHGSSVRTVVREAASRIGAAAAGTQRAAAPEADAAPGTVQSVVVGSPAEQLGVIARRLRERHLQGDVPWSDMAVIVRSGSLVPVLSKGLAALEVPTQVQAATTALRDETAVKAFILALDVTMGRRPLDGRNAVDLLLGPLGGLDPVTLRRLRAALRQQELAGTGNRSADELLVEALTVPGPLALIDNRTARRAAAFGESLRQASADYRAGATIEELLWGLWERSRLATGWREQALGTGIVADEANRNLDAVVALFSAAQRFVERTPSAPPLLFLEHLVDTDVPEDTLAPRAQGDAVVVSTPAGTIGREFSVVVVAGVQDGVWPDLRIRGSLLAAGELAALCSQQHASATDARTAVVHDELRMFAQAASRATAELLVTAVENEDNRASVFFRMLPEPDPDPVTRYPLSLRGLVARFRRDLTGALRPMVDAGRESLPLAALPPRARDAALGLAQLADAGVPGADPSEWYGMRPPSTVQPLNDPEAGDGPVRVSPSKMASFESCPLHWLIGQLSGGGGSTAASLGTIIHKVMEDAVDPTPDALWAAVEERWGELTFDADWQSDVQKAHARELTDRLAAYLADFRRNGSALLQAEGGFEFAIGNAVLSGTIDRVEQLADGRAVIVDLKTGKGDPIADDGVVDHPQLGAYQLAFHEGAIDGIPPGTDLAGAQLVIVSSGTTKKNYRDPMQQPFAPDQREAFRERVLADAAGMGGATFLARMDEHCLDPWSFGSCRIHIITQVSS
ncbi:ATP-dependent helicase [Cryobacterium tepidiphilum]|uniref:ATP-dependent helicase n=1 Tax=Cryobacterium tepidiphilum TaxID=2486026 RepID=UPI001F239F8E|nr:ATP-dependent DNA helicase [Cryobacterium tepidiphilum]